MRNADLEAQARRYVHKHFPDLDDAKCARTTQGAVHVYTFKKRSPVPGGAMTRLVRVTVDETGKIVKAVSSK